MTLIDLPYGDTRLVLRIPADRLGEVIRPAAVDPAPEPDKTIREALQQPIGTPRLADLVRPGQDPERLQSRLSRGTEEDPIGCALAILLGRMKRRIRLGVVSDGLGAEVVRQMGVRRFETAEDAVSAVVSEEDRKTRIAVITHGGVTLPRLRPAGDNTQPGNARKPMEKG